MYCKDDDVEVVLINEITIKMTTRKLVFLDEADEMIEKYPTQIF